MEGVKCTHTEKTRCFPVSGCDGRCPPTNKSEVVKRQDAEKGIRSDATPRSGMPREERHVGNEGADAHTEKGERRAWPNLGCLMKNGQESAYLACPPLHSTAAPPHFLLLLPPTLCLPPLYPPCPFHSFCLFTNDTDISLLSRAR